MTLSCPGASMALVKDKQLYQEEETYKEKDTNTNFFRVYTLEQIVLRKLFLTSRDLLASNGRALLQGNSNQPDIMKRLIYGSYRKKYCILLIFFYFELIIQAKHRKHFNNFMYIILHHFLTHFSALIFFNFTVIFPIFYSPSIDISQIK